MGVGGASGHADQFGYSDHRASTYRKCELRNDADHLEDEMDLRESGPCIVTEFLRLAL